MVKINFDILSTLDDEFSFDQIYVEGSETLA